MHELTQWVLDSIRAHGALSVFLGVIIESVIVPLPSPVIIMGAGAVLVPAELPLAQALQTVFWQIVVPGSIASTLGSLIGYGIGYWGGKPVVERARRFLGFGWDDVQAMERRLSARNGGPVIFLLRALPIVPLSLISIAGGLIRWPIGAFIGWTFLGSVPRCWLLGYLGWAMRGTYYRLAHGMDRVESLVSALIVVGILGVILWLRGRMRQV
jgi:membrane protein DedA with SNARE-associated domain